MYWMSRRLWMGEKADSFPIFKFYRCFFRPIQPDFSLFCKYLFCLAEETLKVCCLIFFSYWNHSGLRRFPAFQFFWTPGLEGCRSSGHHWRRIFLSAPGSQRISDGSVFDHSIGGFGDPFPPWNSACFSWSVLLFSCVLPPVNRPFTHSLTWYWYQIPHNYFFARIQNQCFSFSA